jgi:hypothetical protein
MSRIIDFEREFFKVASALESKSEVKQEFMIRVLKISEEWIDNKLRRDIAGLKDDLRR